MRGTKHKSGHWKAMALTDRANVPIKAVLFTSILYIHWTKPLNLIATTGTILPPIKAY